MRRTFTSKLLAASLMLGTVGGLAGCGNDRAREQAAREKADQLAQALSVRKLGDLTLIGGGQPELSAVLAGAAKTPARVSTADVKLDGDTATVTLEWRWETPGQQWNYQSSAVMNWDEQAWSPVWAPAIVEPSLAAGEVLRITRTQGQRGQILGAEGVAIVKDRKVVRFGIDKTLVADEQTTKSARELAEVLGIDPKAYAKRVDKAGPKAFVEALVLRAADAQEFKGEAGGIPGAVAIDAQMPLAPSREFAAVLLGRVGEATEEIVKASNGSIKSGDMVGLSGLQARYDQQLGGSAGEAVKAVNGEISRVLFQVDPVPGQPLATTLDMQTQKAADRALEGVKSPSALVAIRPSTGDILASAVGSGSQGYNTATVGRYPPGSTMKVVTALALLRAGMKLDDPVTCSQRIVVDGKSFKNYDGYPANRLGRITLRTAVANSCNTAMISQRAKLSEESLSQAAAALGLGVDHDLGFPAYFGQVPPAESQTAKAAAMIGQGEVLASPMVMAAVAASVVRGSTVVPRLLTDRELTDPTPARQLTAKEAGQLRELMEAVVSEGTGSFLADVPGDTIGAKTGTAEFGTKEPLQTHVWMIAYRGDLAVAGFVEVGETGAATVGPILERFLRAVD